MPLFRFKNPPAHLVDATFLFAENPDDDRYEPAEDDKPKAAVKATAPSEES